MVLHKAGVMDKVIFFLYLIPLAAGVFTHPGALHTAADFNRVINFVNAKSTPWYTDWQLLLASPYAQSTYTPQAVPVIYRGDDGVHAQNYGLLYGDAAAMYQLALRWKITGDSVYGDTAVKLLNSWGSTLKQISGSPDQWLATGIYGYQLANAAEIMRTYPGWSSKDLLTFQIMMEDVFAAQNEFFLSTHNGSANIAYASWDLCNMASMLSIAILNDNSTKFDWVINYFNNGPGHGAVGNKDNFIIATYKEPGSGKRLSQGQEAGRDQAHATLDFTLAGVLAQQAYNQGTDLFAAAHNAFLNSYVLPTIIGFLMCLAYQGYSHVGRSTAPNIISDSTFHIPLTIVLRVLRVSFLVISVVLFVRDTSFCMPITMTSRASTLRGLGNTEIM